jgi:hypothetical protein
MDLRFVHLTPGEIDHEKLWGSVAAAGLAGAAIWLRLLGPPPLVCPFRWFTGIPCPACGATRALASLAAGHLAASVHFNPAVLPGCMLALVYITYAAVVVGLRLPRVRLALDQHEGTIARWGTVAAIGAFWIVRIVTWH